MLLGDAQRLLVVLVRRAPIAVGAGDAAELKEGVALAVLVVERAGELQLALGARLRRRRVRLRADGRWRVGAIRAIVRELVEMRRAVVA